MPRSPKIDLETNRFVWSYNLANILDKVLRAGEGRILGKLRNYANAVNALEEAFSSLTDEELKG